MLRLASDADMNSGIVRGLRRRIPELDLIRVQEALEEGAADPDILIWAAREDRVLMTNDRNTMVNFARQRIANGEGMPGLIVTSVDQSIGSAIDDIELLATCLSPVEASERARSDLPAFSRLIGRVDGEALRRSHGQTFLRRAACPSMLVRRRRRC